MCASLFGTLELLQIAHFVAEGMEFVAALVIASLGTIFYIRDV
jgi:hypothetical protein